MNSSRSKINKIKYCPGTSFVQTTLTDTHILLLSAQYLSEERREAASSRYSSSVWTLKRVEAISILHRWPLRIPWKGLCLSEKNYFCLFNYYFPPSVIACHPVRIQLKAAAAKAHCHIISIIFIMSKSHKNTPHQLECSMEC